MHLRAIFYLNPTRPMIIRILLLLFIAATTASALSEENVSQTLDGTPGGRLIIDVDFGTIDVSAGADDKISVVAHRKIDSDNEAQEKEYLASAPVTVSKEGNTFTIRARRQNKERNLSWTGRCSMDARYTVHVPRSFNSELRTGGGMIMVAELTGTMSADTSGGKLKFTHLRGPTGATTSGGSIELNGCEGPLKVDTSGGRIEATDGSGSLEARTSGGSIVVRNFGGDTKVETSGGRLTFENINGKIYGRSSGGSISAKLKSPVPGDVNLETSAGSIDVMVPADAGLDIEAEASSGRVTSDLPFTGTRTDRDSMKGKINGGGKSLVLRTSAGSISIKPASTEVAAR
jgi:Putative adhesin